MRSVALQFKFDDGINAGIPTGGAPSLNDSLVGDEFYVTTSDHAPEHGEGASGVAADIGGQAGEGSELFGVEQNFVDFWRAGF